MCVRCPPSRALPRIPGAPRAPPLQQEGPGAPRHPTAPAGVGTGVVFHGEMTLSAFIYLFFLHFSPKHRPAGEGAVSCSEPGVLSQDRKTKTNTWALGSGGLCGVWREGLLGGPL